MKKRQFLMIAAFFLLVIYIMGCSTNPETSYNLSVSTEPKEGGMVTPEGGEFKEGQTVQITAKPNEGWIFVGWEGNLTGNKNPESLQMESNALVRAVFEKRTYPLNLIVEGNGTILEEVVQAKTVDHPHGTVVKLRPAPESGWRFSHWGGDVLSGNEVPEEILIDQPVNVTATFVPLEGSIRTFGGSNMDIAVSITATSDGGYVLTGYTNSSDGDFQGKHMGNFDLAVVKVDSNGNLEWTRLFGGAKLEQGYSIVETTDGGIVVSGKTPAGSWTTIVIKLDLDGNVLWKRTFESGSGEALTATTDGGVVVTGYSASNLGVFEGLNRGKTDAYLLKLSSTGEVVWVHTYGGSLGEEGRSVIQTAEGGFLITGWAYSNDGTFEGLKDHTNMTGFLIHTDSEGQVEWSKFLTNDDSNHVLLSETVDVTETTDERILLVYSDCTAGETVGSLICRYNLEEVDQNGETLWKKTFSGSGSDSIHGITATDDGGVLLVGKTSSDDGDFSGLVPKGQSDILIHKLTSLGETEWMKSYGGSNSESAESIIQTLSDGYVLTGSFMSNDSDFQGMLWDGSDITIIKTDPNGDLYQEW